MRGKSFRPYHRNFSNGRSSASYQEEPAVASAVVVSAGKTGRASPFVRLDAKDGNPLVPFLAGYVAAAVARAKVRSAGSRSRQRTSSVDL
jgi:hypothetical protein